MAGVRYSIENPLLYFDVNVGGLTSYVNLGVNKRSTGYVVDGDKLARTSFNLRAGKTLGKLKFFILFYLYINLLTNKWKNPKVNLKLVQH